MRKTRLGNNNNEKVIDIHVRFIGEIYFVYLNMLGYLLVSKKKFFPITEVLHLMFRG